MEDLYATINPLNNLNSRSFIHQNGERDLALHIVGDNVILGNVGIGTTMPSRQKVDIIGNTIISNRLGIGGTVNPAKTLDVFGNSYLSGDIGIGVTTARKKVDIDGDTIVSGNIGIGTIHPTSRLDVRGITVVNDGFVGFNTYIPRQQLDVRGEAIISQKVGIGSIYPIHELDVVGDTMITGYTGIGDTRTPRYELDVEGRTIISGNVGIGTTHPFRQKVDIVGSTIISDRLGIGGTINPAKTLDVFGNSYLSGDIGIGVTNARKKVDIDGDTIVTGNIGIGTIHPTSKLDVRGITLVNDGFVGLNTYNPLQQLDVRGNAIVSNRVGISLINPREKLDIDGNFIISGNIGVGTTSVAYGISVNNADIYTNRQYISVIATGTSPMLVSSRTINSNLNAQYLNDKDSYFFTNQITANSNEILLKAYTANMNLSNAIQDEYAIRTSNTLNTFAATVNDKFTDLTQKISAKADLDVVQLFITDTLSRVSGGSGSSSLSEEFYIYKSTYLGKGITGLQVNSDNTVSITEIAGPFLKQGKWSNESTSHSITFPDYSVKHNSSGIIHIQLHTFAPTIAGTPASAIKCASITLFFCNTGLNLSSSITTISVTNTFNTGTSAISSISTNVNSLNHIVVSTGTFCRMCWTSIGAC